MVKSESWQQLLPTRRRVALFATLLERTAVRIHVAVRASAKFHVLVSCRTAGLRRFMALLTVNLNVKACQGIARLGMVELFCGFPIREVVTTLAFVPKLALVRIFVARDAVLRQSKKGFGKILHLDERALIGNHVAGHVALFTCHAGVLAFQHVPCEPMVELFLRWLPVNQPEVFPIVIQVAPHAVLAVGVRHSQPCMVAVVQG